MKTLGIVFSNLHDKKVAELTAARTLASVPFGGRYRLIDFVLSNMVNSGIKKVGVITKNNYQSLMEHVGSGKDWDLSRKNGGLIILPPFGGTDSLAVYTSRFEALKGISSFIRRSSEEYVVMSDCHLICNIDYRNIIEKHIENSADITIVTTKRRIEPRNEGSEIVESDATGRVTKVSTTKLGGVRSILTHIMVIKRALLLNILDGSNDTGITSISRDILQKGTEMYRIYEYEHKGYYADIESLSSYYTHSMELLDKDTRDKLFNEHGASIYTRIKDTAPFKISSVASVSNSLIADGCEIDGEVVGSILFRGVKVKKGAKVINSILMQDTVIDCDSTVNCIIADKNVQVLQGRLLSGHPTHPYFIHKGNQI